MLEVAFVRAVAERLLLGEPAAADAGAAAAPGGGVGGAGDETVPGLNKILLGSNYFLFGGDD
ncbi:hypothetical protein GCM10022409_40160 [Hymenobacter glaciei]|uniref:Uncharacterized protein n=1 Tax=Hymenobacter glaciei TaxID=877209 RepID=A0ABP7UQ72_9BACT